MFPLPGGDDAHFFEGIQDARRDWCIRTADEHGRNLAAADQHGCVGEGIGAAGAASREHVRWTPQVEMNRQLAGEVSVRAGGDGEEGESALCMKLAVLLFD